MSPRTTSPHPPLLDRRLAVQCLFPGTQLESAAAVVRRLGAVQSQDYIGARWSLVMRTKDATDASIDRELSQGGFLRTHVLRPTWHFVAPEDIRWMLALTAPHVHRLCAYVRKFEELDAKLLSRCCTEIERALQGRSPLTREEVGAALLGRGIDVLGSRLAHVMMFAELEALVCSGALKGKKQTYALLDERAPAWRPLARADAVVALCCRFFAGHSPATLAHFTWWSGLPARDARMGLEAVRGDLSSETIDGIEWFALGDAPAPRRTTKLVAYLLPEFDEALIGVKDMGVPDFPSRKRPKPLKFAFDRPIIIGGRRAGQWKRPFQTMPFSKLGAREAKALAEAESRYLAAQG